MYMTQLLLPLWSNVASSFRTLFSNRFVTNLCASLED